MRVVSLLPAATEIVAALGGRTCLVGISHECDYPASVLDLPGSPPRPIDIVAAGGAHRRRSPSAERERASRSSPIDADALRRLAPDLIITQSLCQVCACHDGQVYRLAAGFDRRRSCPARRDDAGRASGQTSGRSARRWGSAGRRKCWSLGLQARLADLAAPGAAPPAAGAVCRVAGPAVLAGHWVPELVAAAGGRDPAVTPGSHSTRREWSEVVGLRPDLILVMLCGFGVERSLAEFEAIGPEARAALATAPVWILDGNAYTSRPGPRLVDGAERIAAALRGEELPGLVRWRDAVSLRA